MVGRTAFRCVSITQYQYRRPGAISLCIWCPGKEWYSAVQVINRHGNSVDHPEKILVVYLSPATGRATRKNRKIRRKRFLTVCLDFKPQKRENNGKRKCGFGGGYYKKKTTSRTDGNHRENENRLDLCRYGITNLLKTRKMVIYPPNRYISDTTVVRITRGRYKGRWPTTKAQSLWRK